MTIELKKIAGMGAVVAALAAVPAMAQEITEWDGDGNGALSEDEDNAGVFSSYDDDASGAIEEQEFGDVGDDMGDGGF